MLRWSVVHVGQGVGRLKAGVTLTHWRSHLGLGTWALAMGLNLALLVLSLPYYLASIGDLGERAAPLSPALQAGMALETLLGVVYLGTAGVLVWLGWREGQLSGMTRLVAVMFAFMGVGEWSGLRSLIDPALNPRADAWLPWFAVHKTVQIYATFLLVYCYPDGLFRPRWTGLLAVGHVPLAFWTSLHVAWDLHPTLTREVWGIEWPVSMVWTGVSAMIITPLGALGRFLRLREDRARGERTLESISWSLILMLCGLTVLYNADVFFQTPLLSPDERYFLDALFLTVCLTWFPVALFRSMLRYGLHDHERLAGRALTGVLLSGVIAGAYLLLMYETVQTFKTSDTLTLSVLATVFATLLFAPLRDLIQRRVNRFLYGERDQPMKALRTLTEQLAQARTPQGALTVLAQTSADTLKLPYLCLEAPEIPFRLELGRLGAPPEAFPLLADGAEVGRLVVCAGAPLSHDVRAMLQAVAQQAAQVVQNWQLTAQVQQSRQTLVGAREDERRRLRRELHDGLGPTLAAQTLRIGSARLLLPRDPAAVERLLAQLEGDVQRAIGDVRRVVEDLRPPALDDLGLVGALERVISELSAGLSVQVRVEVPSALPPLRAAVEVAAYRIVLEAVTNVVRHAQARHCAVRLWPGGDVLRVEVEDDGAGGAHLRPGHVGLRGMRERAEELGGTFELTSAPGGTRLVARLPLLDAPPRLEVRA